MTEKIQITKNINAPSEKVWAAISGIGGLDKWFPIIATCEVTGSGVGAKRVCGMPNGAKMHETIEEINHDTKRFRYSINESPMPISNYMGTVDMKESGNGTELSWTAEFDVPAEARDEIVSMLTGALSAGVDGLAADLGG